MGKERKTTAATGIVIISLVSFFISSEIIRCQTLHEQSIVTYNILDYAGDNSADDSRESSLRKVVQYVSPDILVAEEVHGTTGYTHMLDDILNYDAAGLYEGAPFSDQPAADIDIALFYKSEMFENVSTKIIDIASLWGLRDAVEFVMRHIPTGIEFKLYGVHLKAGSDPDNETERESEASKLRNYLNTLEPGSHFLVLGDLNSYYAEEGGFQRLVEPQNDNDGKLFDPVERLGYWHNNNSYRDVHTQSSRGYDYGGLDDRFDFILASAAIVESTDLNILPDSYTALGNDGNHFNQAINEGNNSAVPADIANALVVASDHLPVLVKLQFLGREESEYRIVIDEIMQNPEVVSDSYGEWFEIYNADTIDIDLRGWTILDNDNDEHAIQAEDPIVIEPGDFRILARNGDPQLNGGVQALYDYSGFLLANDEDEIILLDENGAEVDRVEYDGGDEFPDPRGASMALMDLSMDNNIGSNWAISTTAYGDGDNLGTPGQANIDVSIDEVPPLPERIQLFPNHPNPFNTSTTIPFELPYSENIELVIYDIRGYEVAKLLFGEYEAGRYEIRWDAGKLPSGIYFYQLRSQNTGQTRKLLLIK